MLTFSTNQWIILILVLILGWLLGLLTRGSGTKYRHAWQEEHSLREAAEARAASAEAQLAEVERNAAHYKARASGRDELSLIRGIGISGEARLRELGISSYEQIIDLSPAEEAGLEARIGARPGTIEAEQWREQARLLAHNERETHRHRFG